LKSDFIKVWRILRSKERRQLSLAAGFQAFSGLMDMVGVVSIVPFLSVVGNPELLQSNTTLAELKSGIGFSDEHFLILLGLSSFVVLILNQAVRLVSGYYCSFVSERLWWALDKRVFRYYLSQTYLYHLQHSGNALLEKLQMRVNAAVAGVISPMFFLVSSLCTTVFVVLLLIWAEPVMTLTLFGVIVGFYLLMYQKLKARLDLYGKVGPEFSSKTFKLIAEAFGAIKEIKVRGNGQIYLDLFDPLAKRFCDTQVKRQLVTAVPACMVEILAFGGILLITLFLIKSSQGLKEILPTVGLFALSLRRILPAVQQAYRQITEIRFYQPSFQIIHGDLVAALASNEAPLPELRKSERHSFNQKIELKELSFAYPGSTRKVLNSISLVIPAGSLIGIAGSSGAGKTTLIDLILGLFEPGSGNILIDGQPLIEETLSKWQAGLGYVPQEGFIADDTIARNIAFGLHNEEIDMERVKQVAEFAQISGFIESELVQQYDTFVGERGIRLSGGQRQRLSLARALYHDSGMLILDEATSALDGIMEEKVMDSIRNLSGQKTILLIAHRLTTLKQCDTIFLLEEGKLIDEGTYHSLMDTNITFRRMAREAIEEKV